MWRVGGVLAMLLMIACGSAAGTSTGPKATPTPAPSPTPVEAGSILGSWHLDVTTTQAYGDVTVKVGEQYTRDWTLVKECPVANCAAHLETVTRTGPAVLNWFFENGVYTSQLTDNFPCPDPNNQGGAIAVSGEYRLVMTASTLEGGVFKATSFAGSFIETLNPNPAAAAQQCRQSHIEQRLIGTRTS